MREPGFINWEILEVIAKHTNLIIDFSGAFLMERAGKKLCDGIANKVTIGSIAVKGRIR